MNKTDENLKIAFADESQTNIEYLAYAHKAIEEGFVEIAQLFREAAGAEVVHALNHLKTMDVVKTTGENLKEAAEGESLQIISIYPKFIKAGSGPIFSPGFRAGKTPPDHVPTCTQEAKPVKESWSGDIRFR